MDKNYWDNFYKNHSSDETLQKESTFARFCQENIFKDQKYNILELGSGNGRDAIFFAEKGHSVTAVDQSIAIQRNIKNLDFEQQDFIQMEYSKFKDINVVYSRFTLHAIEVEKENIVIDKVFNHLPDKGLFLIEVRSIKDELFGKGKNVGNNGFITTHYRRFIDSDLFVKKMLAKGFKLRYFTEENNLSIYENDNPFLIRVVFIK
ncbi:class I SAM-dependent methyltransferase [Legionella sp. km772]|uniref:class I SAM-dependent methyltransferase n=1 Tax=Legionella sp. km772 TaxID=2498111 RepID=UPI000F8CB014|nr:class I SAM-dependent methyltransferase [Legionella sp. km772]RUR10165.1 class I SAM-dependent methyltransferase [Legionella sp. km772]